MIRFAAVLGFTGVLLGAFGAHGLRSWVSDPHLWEVWDTAARYQLIHAVALLAGSNVCGRAVAVAWGLGVLLFSGSLYAMALTELRVLGAVTPLGGLCFLVGWALLFRRGAMSARSGA